ncbi:MAG: hypothetical protein ABIS07_04665, partial [Dokdonella sp.]
MISPFISAIGALAPCLCLLLALFLFAAGGPLKRVNRYLAMFLLLAGMDMAGWAANLLPMALRETLIFRLPLCYLQAPLLYVYASKLCFPARRVSLHLWAAAATVVVCILSMAPRAWAWWSGVAPALSSLSSRETDLIANAAVLHAQYYIYIALMLHRLLEYRRTYRSSYSNPDGITFAWLSTIVGTSLFAHTFLLLKSLAWISDRAATYHALDRVVAAIAMLAVCGLTLAALLRQHLFLGVTTEPDDTGEPAPIVPAPVAVVIAHHEAIA